MKLQTVAVPEKSHGKVVAVEVTTRVLGQSGTTTLELTRDFLRDVLPIDEKLGQEIAPFLAGLLGGSLEEELIDGLFDRILERFPQPESLVKPMPNVPENIG